MISLNNVREKEFIERQLEHYGNEELAKVIFESGVTNEDEATAIAQFYWEMVDKAEEDDAEYLLERVYNSFSIHMGNVGFEQVWEREIP